MLQRRQNRLRLLACLACALLCAVLLGSGPASAGRPAESCRPCAAQQKCGFVRRLAQRGAAAGDLSFLSPAQRAVYQSALTLYRPLFCDAAEFCTDKYFGAVRTPAGKLTVGAGGGRYVVSCTRWSCFRSALGSLFTPRALGGLCRPGPGGPARFRSCGGLLAAYAGGRCTESCGGPQRCVVLCAGPGRVSFVARPNGRCLLVTLKNTEGGWRVDDFRLVNDFPLPGGSPR